MPRNSSRGTATSAVWKIWHRWDARAGVLVAPALHVLFGYSPRHDRAGVDKLLAGYRGDLVAVAHAVYDHLYARRTRCS